MPSSKAPRASGSPAAPPIRLPSRLTPRSAKKNANAPAAIPSVSGIAPPSWNASAVSSNEMLEIKAPAPNPIATWFLVGKWSQATRISAVWCGW